MSQSHSSVLFCDLSIFSHQICLSFIDILRSNSLLGESFVGVVKENQGTLVFSLST